MSENWECRLDAAGRRRYYLNDKFVPAKAVPANILGKLDCTAGMKSPSKKSPAKKTIVSKKESLKSPVKRESLKIPSGHEYKSYIDLLPGDLLRALIPYFTRKNLKKICEADSLQRVCKDDEFWHKLVLTRFTADPKAKPEGKLWKGWYHFYTEILKRLERAKTIYRQITYCLNSNLEQLIGSYVDDITDPELLYYILVTLYRWRGFNFDVIKKLITDKKVNWPVMYQHGRNYQHVWESLNDKYHVYLNTKESPLHGNYPLEAIEYLMSFVPPNYPYLQELLQSLLNGAIRARNLPVINYIFDTYPKIPFDFDELRWPYSLARSDEAIQILELLKNHGANLRIADDVII